MYVCMHACMHVCMYACMFVCMYVRMYVYVTVCVCMYVYIYMQEPRLELPRPGVEPQMLLQELINEPRLLPIPHGALLGLQRSGF